ncbi:hypothetical protein KVR01_001800 [Diaporthe batatas]|uniref:uncharacterized protein n=1 Tax=Diaporthe batatas TaxID=748121 RepID=UPI001D04464A|nr:uncharacterized protein KVR01_001800 [Diaporthe batatas]KAG8169051.1 hypothetical protein KVR01_001800 [Diaporthe batatas]
MQENAAKLYPTPETSAKVLNCEFADWTHMQPSKPFGLIFLDANKDAYPKYLDLILSKSQPESRNRQLKPGGIIVADNVLGQAIVADVTATNPHYAEAVARLGEKRAREFNNEALHQFNDKLVAEPWLEAFLVPLFEGLGLNRRLTESDGIREWAGQRQGRQVGHLLEK